MYYSPDLTGSHPDYLRDNNLFRIHTLDQKIELTIPIYEESIEITRMGSVNQILEKDVDWCITEEDIDHTSMSRMMAYDNTFNKTLVKSITISRTFVEPFDINISAQQLYPNNIRTALHNGSRVEFTPQLLSTMLGDIDYLYRITKNADNALSITDSNPFMFKKDPDGEREENIVISENHTINTHEDRRYIRPLGGAFYNNNTLDIRMKDNPDQLIEGEDYILVGFDTNRTRVTSVPGGVYNYIYFKKEYSGIIEIDYHAYGGDVNLYDIEILNEKLVDVISFLKESTFLTENGLSNTEIINQILLKINSLEDDVRQLYSTRPSYGDVTTGNSSRFEITANDNDNHWFSIAELYQIDGSTEIITSDRAFLRIGTLHTGFNFDIMVSVNINNANDPITVNVLSENYPKGYIPYQDYSDVANIIRPRVRVIYNDNDEQNSGILLQIGMELKNIVEETIVVEDMGGKECCWKLLPSPDEVMVPEDNAVQLPNSNHIYDDLNPDSRAIESLVPFKDGYLIFAGNLSLNRPDGGFKEFDIDHYFDDSIDIRNISSCRIELQMQNDNSIIPIDIKFVRNTNDKLGTATFTYNDENAYMTANLYRDDDDSIKLVINSVIDMSTNAAEITLRHIYLYA